MNRTKGYIFTILAAVGFGAQPLMATWAYSCGIGDKLLALLRVAYMAPLFAVIVLAKKGESFRVTGGQLVKIFILAATGAVLTTSMLFTAYICIDTGTATTLNFTYPVFVLALGALIYREKITKHIAVCFALCCAGILLFCDPSGNFTWRGFFLALGSGLAYGVYVLYLDKSRIMEGMGLYSYTFWFFLLSTLMLLPVTAAAGQLDFGFPAKGWLFAALFALDGGLVATVCLQVGVREIGSRKASVLSALEPVTSMALGLLFLNERIKLTGALGIALVLASTIYLVLGEKPQEP